VLLPRANKADPHANNKPTPSVTTKRRAPQANDANCGLARHTIVKTRDYVLGSGKREIVEAGPGR